MADNIFKSEQSKRWKNKQRTLVVCSRGITPRQRHLMLDIFNLLPHGKKDVKLEKKNESCQISELCLSHSCKNYLFFESKKKRDLYLWIGQKEGVCCKLFVENIHTSDELQLTGNCLKGSRPVLSFDHSFDSLDQLKLLKQLIVNAFNVPEYHPKSQPFVDHVFQFTYTNDRIWFRNYQIFRTVENKQTEKIELYEIGPRMVLNPMIILDDCMTGDVLFKNNHFVSPQQKVNKLKQKRILLQNDNIKKKVKRENMLSNIDIPVDEVDAIFNQDSD